MLLLTALNGMVAMLAGTNRKLELILIQDWFESDEAKIPCPELFKFAIKNWRPSGVPTILGLVIVPIYGCQTFVSIF